MPFIAAVSTIDLPYKTDQQEVKQHIHDMFTTDFSQIERLMGTFDNTDIKFRNLSQPFSYYTAPKSFEEHNNEYLRCALEYSVKAVEQCVAKANIDKQDITDILFVSSTGLATPSMDAMIVNALRLNPHIQSFCRSGGWAVRGGVSGVAKANALAKANPRAVVVLVAVELCTLTFLKNDYSKSNFIASSLFSDGIAACIIKGDEHGANSRVRVVESSSKLYYDSLEVMGWEFLDTGFKVLFSKDIPTFIHSNIKDDILSFLSKHNLELP